MDRNAILEASQHWVQTFVIGLNMCPFARAPADRDGIRYTLARGQSEEEVLADLLHECQMLDEHPEVETTLLILPTGWSNFEEFMDFFTLAEAFLETTPHHEIVQLVSFHPNYCFADATADDPANATNQSPWPTIHLLRRADVTQAIAAHPDTHRIPARNVETLRAMRHKPND